MKQPFAKIAAGFALLPALCLVAQTPPGDAARGKDLFVKDACYQCHGREGQGGAAGPRIAPHPIALKALIAYVRHPAGQMPPVTPKVVSDADLADIYAFLETIPEPKPAKDIPLLNQLTGPYKPAGGHSEANTQLPDGKGKEIVATKCLSCHSLDKIEDAHHSPYEWQNVINTMVTKGAHLAPDEVSQVISYLSANFGADTNASGHSDPAAKSNK